MPRTAHAKRARNSAISLGVFIVALVILIFHICITSKTTDAVCFALLSVGVIAISTAVVQMFLMIPDNGD